MIEGNCKQTVWDDFQDYQCSRKAWKDGYCKQHHPDIVAEKRRRSMERHNEKRKNDPLYQLALARKRLDSGREYLMSISADKITVEDTLEAFGFRRDGVIE